MEKVRAKRHGSHYAVFVDEVPFFFWWVDLAGKAGPGQVRSRSGTLFIERNVNRAESWKRMMIYLE